MDVSLFFLLGGGEGESEAPGRGEGLILLNILTRWVSRAGWGGGGTRGLEGVCGELGGVAKYFFRAEMPTKRRFSESGFKGKRVLERAPRRSGFSRRCLERPVGGYCPLGVCPISVIHWRGCDEHWQSS